MHRRNKENSFRDAPLVNDAASAGSRFEASLGFVAASI